MQPGKRLTSTGRGFLFQRGKNASKGRIFASLKENMQADNRVCAPGCGSLSGLTSTARRIFAILAYARIVSVAPVGTTCRGGWGGTGTVLPSQAPTPTPVRHSYTGRCMRSRALVGAYWRLARDLARPSASLRSETLNIIRG